MPTCQGGNHASTFRLLNSSPVAPSADRHAAWPARSRVALPAQAEIKGLDIIAPANPGGGWDQTARAMQAALQTDGLASGVQVENIGGAGGTIGLAQFVSGKGKKGDAVLVGGLVMVGAILTNKSPVTLANVTPLARLTGEYELIVVPADSPIQTHGRPRSAKLKADPGSVSWGGGSAGGTDHILAGLIAKAAGRRSDQGQLHRPFRRRRGAVGRSSAATSPPASAATQEFAPQIAAGKLRGIGISVRRARCPASTCRRSRSRGSTSRWSTGAACSPPPSIRDKDMAALSDAVGKMVESPAWQDTLKERGWLNLYQPADEFAAFLAEDQSQGRGHAQGDRPRPVAFVGAAVGRARSHANHPDLETGDDR